MSRKSTLYELSSSSTTADNVLNSDTNYQCIKRFLNVAVAMSGSVFNFDIFSKISTKVRIFDFLVLEIIVGVPYLCMDFFIKQYTRRFDCNKNLNPLLRGITYGQFLQTGVFSLVHGSFIVDTVRFLIGALKQVPAWAVCATEENTNITCVPVKDIILHCNQNITTNFLHTAPCIYYKHYFTYGENITMTSRLFMTAIVWMVTFFLSSVTEETTVKIFKLTLIFRILSTICTLITLLAVTEKERVSAAFSHMIDVTTESSWIASMDLLSFTYGIGFLGIYDFGTSSPHTMVDTACVLYMISFTSLSLMRSLIVKILYLAMMKCVVLDEAYIITTHNLLYALLPLGTEFLHAKKFYVFYIFGNVTVTLLSLETFMISTMSRFLHSEFPNVKQIYIVGIVCTSGFVMTVWIIFDPISDERKLSVWWERGLGLDILVLYLSVVRVVIVMWIYGVKRFATDIHFWLGFRPTRFWTLTWSCLPIILIGFMINKIYLLLQVPSMNRRYIWIVFTFLVVLVLHSKTISNHLVKNNLIGLFKANKNYGPPDAEDRKRRHFFNDVRRGKRCRHNCMTIDEIISCDHNSSPIRKRFSTQPPTLDEPSITHVYKDEFINDN